MRLNVVDLSTRTVPPSVKLVVEGRTYQVIGDANGFVEHCLKPAPFDDADEGKPCIVTGQPGLKVKTRNTEICLAPEIVKRFFLVALTKKEFKAVQAVNPSEWWIHDDFYEADGTACQPKCQVPKEPKTPKVVAKAKPVKMDFD